MEVTFNLNSVCDKCIKAGWLVGEEMQKAIIADPILGGKIEHQSPYFKKP